MIRRGTKVIVSETSKLHPGRIGYLAFYGVGESKGIAVLTTEKDPDPRYHAMTYFAVKNEEISKV